MLTNFTRAHLEFFVALSNSGGTLFAGSSDQMVQMSENHSRQKLYKEAYGSQKKYKEAIDREEISFVNVKQEERAQEVRSEFARSIE